MQLVKYKKIIFLLGVSLCLVLQLCAHVGSSGVLYQGQAGGYRVLVSLMPPDVIPGTANVTVYVEEGNAKKVMARPIYFRTGDEGAPSADELLPVVGQVGQFQGVAWLMAGGASSVQITIEGDKGKSELVVPIAAISTAQREMPAGLGVLLSALGLLLVVLLVTTIGASASDGLLKAGESLTTKQKRARLVNMGVAVVACTLILYGGSSWWSSWADDYKQHLYKPLEGKAAVIDQSGERLFQLKIDTTHLLKTRQRTTLSFLIPDHGKS